MDRPSDPQRIAAPLRDLIARLRLSKPLLGWQAVELWGTVVGHRVAAHSRAVAFREGTVIVEVDSAAWISELGYLKRRIAGELNRRLGGDIVHDIRLQPAASPPRTSRPQKP